MRQRVNRDWCRHEARDGRICVLYTGHEGKHKEKHLASEWGDSSGSFVLTRDELLNPVGIQGIVSERVKKISDAPEISIWFDEEELRPDGGKTIHWEETRRSAPDS